MLFIQNSLPDWQTAQSNIDIWRFKLDKYPEQFPNCLDETEASRADRFHFSRHQRRFRVARTLLRILLGKYLNTAPEAICFTYQTNGKPELSNDSQLTFNLSHSKDFACLAVGRNWPIGVDIECLSGRDYLGIGCQVFSPQELENLKKLPAFLLPSAFFSLWSEKEAVIKCNGKGMSYPLKQLTLPLFASDNHLFTDIENNRQQKLCRFTPYIGVAGALCCHPAISSIRFYEYRFYP